jgi:PEGA domain
MQRRSVISPNFPRFAGPWLAIAGLTLQTLPATAQTGPTKASASAAAPSASAPAATPNGSQPTPATPPAGTAPAAPAGPQPATPTSPGATPPATTPPGVPPEGQSAIAPTPTAEQAETALTQGQEAYRTGDYVSAEQWFDKANTLQPSASALYWRAMSIDLQGRAADAVVAYEELFANPGHEQLAPNLLDGARQRAEVLNKIPATLLLNVAPADAQVVVDGTLQSGAPPYVLKLTSGRHKLHVTRDGYTALDTEVNVKAAQSTEQTLQLQAKASATPEAGGAASPGASEPRSKVPAYVTLGVAGVAAGLGTVFGIQALSAQDDFKASPTAATADDVERNALIADMAWGIAITLGITGTVLLTSDEPSDEAPPTARGLWVAPYASAEGGGARAKLTF